MNRLKPFEDLVLAMCEVPEKCDIEVDWNNQEVSIRCEPCDAKRLVGKGGTAFKALIVVLHSIDRHFLLLPIQSSGKHNGRFTPGNGDGSVNNAADLLGRVLGSVFGGDPHVEVRRLDGHSAKLTASVRTNMPEYRLSELSDALHILFIPIGIHFNTILHVQVIPSRSVPVRQSGSW